MRPPPAARLLHHPLAWWTVIALVCLLVLAPLWVADIPPILDYPNHLARLFILAHVDDDPVLASIWQPQWDVIPDLAIDIVGPPLMDVLSPFAAGKVILAAALLLPMAGAVLYSRVAFGARLYWPMTAGLMAYNLDFVLGFLNYLIAVGLALMAAALWLRLSGRKFLVRAGVGAACASALFFVHLFGVAFFALLAGSAELALFRARRRERRSVRGALRRAALLGTSFAAPAVLWLLVPEHDSSDVTLHWSFLSKLFFLPSAFVAYRALPGVLVCIVFFGVAGYWLFWRRCRTAPGIALAAIVILAAMIALPFNFAGGTYVDSRLPIMLSLLLAAGIAPPATRPSFVAIGAAAVAAVLLLQVSQVGVIWRGYQTEVAAVRNAILPVTPGSKVLEVSVPTDPENPYWNPPPPGAIAMSALRTDHHLAALVTIDRRAFWPLLFSDPAQHPITVEPPYAALTGVALPAGPEALVLGRSPDPDAPAPYLDHWEDNFDYVLVIDAGAAGDLRNFLPDKLELLNQSKFAALFRVRKAGDAPTRR
jgi:hypothetical protein